MEFHISSSIRERLDLDELLFSFTGNVIFANVAASRKLAQKLQALRAAETGSNEPINAGALFAMGLIDELSHALVARYRQEQDPAVLADALRWFGQQVTPAQIDRLLLSFSGQFPNLAVYRKEMTAQEWLKGTSEGMPNREAAFEEMMLLWLSNSNPAFAPFRILFEDRDLKQHTAYTGVTSALPSFFATRPPVSPGEGSLIDALRAPMLASPDSLIGQLDFIRENWSPYLGEDLQGILLAIDVLREEEVGIWMRFHPAGPDHHRHGAPGFGGEGFVGDEFVGFEEDFITGPDGIRRRRYATDYQAPLNEYENFSADQAWMPTVVLIAKSTYVWLEQLSKKYLRHIHRLDQIPDEELRLLATRGITGLWLIGLWERSRASRTIKRLRGNPDAVASAYSLKDYSIAEDIGGEAAYVNLRDRAARAGLRLASDMVPNHMGIDSNWVIEHPEWFLARSESPFPAYGFEGPDLSTDSRVEIKIEDHYYDQTDAAVVFRLRHHRDGHTRFVYHGNDGTTFAWNDTAQLDYSKADVREHVIQVILNVARRFPIIRFDAAMVLAKRHVQRLWFPLPGAGGSIPSRAENAISEDAFDALMPHEFWREVVDRVAVEVPGTLLLAEAFWLLESYFVRTLGMHRVYNSAFMNMIRDEENAKYRSYLKKTVEFDPDILKRYVNFMSNPDEKTAVDQFGSGDKFFGTSVLLATLPGLPMLGHGQIEGYTERYGMDFKQARLDESPNEGLVERHQQLIAPLLKNRQLFAESTHFLLYDFWTSQGTVDENVFAHSNRSGDQRGLIFYNNTYGSTHGTIHMSVGFLQKSAGSLQQRSLAEGLALPGDESLVIAYRDAVTDLEYLCRVASLRNDGLTLGLQGYQHVVLLNWRELRSTSTHPWDRLCDSLHGAGVPNLDEALSRLRLQPLVDALRRAIHTSTLQSFTEAANQLQTPKRAATKVPATASTSEAIEITGEAPLANPSSSPAENPELQFFIENTRLFVGRVLETANQEGIKHDLPAPEPVAISLATRQLSATEPTQPEDKLKNSATLASAAIRLPTLVAAFPEALQPAIHVVLPSTSSPPVQLWAPVLAWIALQALPPQSSALILFDELQLRLVLAETFFSIGIYGEDAWRAAARVRLLLKMGNTAEPLTAMQDEAFWQDPDVRWLAGVNKSSDIEYLNKESFEELVCWLQLPALLKIAQSQTLPRQTAYQVATSITKLTEVAQQASYQLRSFLNLFTAQSVENEQAAIASEPLPKQV